jgi:hypothetical protein
VQCFALHHTSKNISPPRKRGGAGEGQNPIAQVLSDYRIVSDHFA